MDDVALTHCAISMHRVPSSMFDGDISSIIGDGMEVVGFKFVGRD